MGRNKLSQQLSDAYMIGDKDRIVKIKNKINAQFDTSRPKKGNNVIKVNTVLNDDDSSAKSVYIFLNKVFGRDWWEWEIETLYRMLWIKYGVALEDINRDKVLAIRHVCRSDNAFADWFEFNQVALSFSGCIADFEMLRAPSPGMAISAVKTLNYIRPDRNSFFSNDVIKYICIILKNNGIYVPPPSIALFIQNKMKEMISDKTKELWLKVYGRYKEIIKDKNFNLSEEPVDIQTKRILNAEASAIKYGT